MIAAKTQIKYMIKQNGVQNMSNDFMEMLDRKIELLVKDACDRAVKNARRTVMARDL
jgi:histone H3/H4